MRDLQLFGVLLGLSLLMAVLVVRCSAPGPGDAADSGSVLAAAGAGAGAGAEPVIQLACNGNSNYRIVIPKDAGGVVRDAAEELRMHLEQITGAVLPVVDDTRPRGPHEIVVGNGARLDEHGIEPAVFADLGADGFVIRTCGTALVLAGSNPAGTRNAVFAFLEDHLGCRMYAPDAVRIPRREMLILGAIDERQVPVFTHRETHYYFPLTDDRYVRWHRLTGKIDRNRDWGMWVHTFDRLVPQDEYFGEHPEYFCEINGRRVRDGQLCLSHPEVFEILCANLDRMMAEKPQARIWSVSQNDNYNYCTCKECCALNEQYGAHSGSLLAFVNRVARKFPDKVISTLAYQYSRAAPEGIVPERNVNIMFCSIECNRSRPLATDPGEADFRKDLEDWGRLTDNILIWDYVVQFRNLLDPFPNLHVLQPNLRFFARNNCTMMFQQGSGGSITEFHELRTYLIAKLLWNPGADVDAVMDDFLEGYYGAAAAFIRGYIDRMHAALIASGGRLDIYGYPKNGIDTYLTPELLKEYARLFDRAEKAIRGDPERLERVRRARLPLEFAILDLATHDVNDDLTYLRRRDGLVTRRDKMLQRLDDFVRACGAHGIERLEEHGYSPADFKADVEELVAKSERVNLARGKPVNVLTRWSDKYPVGGARALTDGSFGLRDFHYNWLGFENADLKAIVDLGTETEIRRISADFLQEPLSWIFLPAKIEYFASQDGRSFERVASLANEISQRKGKVIVHTFAAVLDGVRARYVKVHAESLKLCPDWHRGAGQPAWIFVDEIIVE